MSSIVNIHRMDRTKNTITDDEIRSSGNLLTINGNATPHKPHTYDYGDFLTIQATSLNPENFSGTVFPLNNEGVIVTSQPTLPPTLPVSPDNTLIDLTLDGNTCTATVTITYPQYTTVVVDIDGVTKITFPPGEDRILLYEFDTNDYSAVSHTVTATGTYGASSAPFTGTGGG